jgi:hypothetical protein
MEPLQATFRPYKQTSDFRGSSSLANSINVDME